MEESTPEHSQHAHHAHEDFEDVKTLLSWTAPGRPFKKKDREFFIAVGLITLFIEVILFLVSAFSLMLVVAAFVFLTIVLAITPPKNFHYKITNQGIKVEDMFYIWEELYDFYFKKMSGADVLIVRTHGLPWELHIPIEEHAKDSIRKILIRYIAYREVVRPTFMEAAADWLSQTFPLDKIRQEIKP